jgi:hypothetical protein
MSNVTLGLLYHTLYSGQATCRELWILLRLPQFHESSTAEISSLEARSPVSESAALVDGACCRRYGLESG